MRDRLIVADSCCDIPEELKEKINMEFVPFTISLDDENYLDDENLDVQKFIKDMKNAETVKSAAPSPKLFMNKFEMAKEVFCVTISSKLSATYSNAILAKTMVEEAGEKLIHIFDSKSAAATEVLIVLKLQECIEKNMNFNEIVKTVTEYIEETKIYFVLDNLDNLIRNGRISKAKARLASVLSIKPVLTGVDGEVEIYKKVRGLNNAYNELVNLIEKNVVNMEEKYLVITHCNALEKANEIREKIIERYNFKKVFVVAGRGLASTYENEGGIIISY